MSKERELLVHALDRLKHINFEDDHLTNDLIQTIQKYLAQPEQVQEPVAWKVIDGTNGKYMFSRIKPTERSYKYDVVIPLYTAPPRREPLSDKEIQILYGRHAFAMELDEYMWGFIDAEKAHGIGGGE